MAATPDATIGLGGYYTKLKSGDGAPPVAEFVTGEALGKAAPTNQKGGIGVPNGRALKARQRYLTQERTRLSFRRQLPHSPVPPVRQQHASYIQEQRRYPLYLGPHQRHLDPVFRKRITSQEKHAGSKKGVPTARPFSSEDMVDPWRR